MTCKLQHSTHFVCIVTGAALYVSYECRAARTPNFQISCINNDDVIRIVSAEFGLNEYLDASIEPCVSLFTEPPCMLSTGRLKMTCNNRNQCTFGSEVFRVSQCVPRQNDVITVTYHCIDHGE